MWNGLLKMPRTQRQAMMLVCSRWVFRFSLSLSLSLYLSIYLSLSLLSLRYSLLFFYSLSPPFSFPLSPLTSQTSPPEKTVEEEGEEDVDDEEEDGEYVFPEFSPSGNLKMSWADMTMGPAPSSTAPRDRKNGRSLHDKLSSPDRKKKTSWETQKHIQTKHDMAEIRRTQLEEEKQMKLARQAERVEEVTLRHASLVQQKKEKHETRLEKAEEIRQEFIEKRRGKAVAENQKVDEVAFITTMNNVSKKQEHLQKLRDSEQRRQEHLQSRIKVAQRDANKDRVIERRKAMERAETQRQILIQKRHDNARLRREQARRKERGWASSLPSSPKNNYMVRDNNAFFQHMHADGTRPRSISVDVAPIGIGIPLPRSMPNTPFHHTPKQRSRRESPTCMLDNLSNGSNLTVDVESTGENNYNETLLGSQYSSTSSTAPPTMDYADVFIQGQSHYRSPSPASFSTLDSNMVSISGSQVTSVQPSPTYATTARWCTLCNVKLLTDLYVSRHLEGKKHRSAVEAAEAKMVDLSGATGPSVTSSTPSTTTTTTTTTTATAPTNSTANTIATVTTAPVNVNSSSLSPPRESGHLGVGLVEASPSLASVSVTGMSGVSTSFSSHIISYSQYEHEREAEDNLSKNAAAKNRKKKCRKLRHDLSRSSLLTIRQYRREHFMGPLSLENIDLPGEYASFRSTILSLVRYICSRGLSDLPNTPGVENENYPSSAYRYSPIDPRNDSSVIEMTNCVKEVLRKAKEISLSHSLSQDELPTGLLPHLLTLVEVVCDVLYPENIQPEVYQSDRVSVCYCLSLSFSLSISSSLSLSLSPSILLSYLPIPISPLQAQHLLQSASQLLLLCGSRSEVLQFLLRHNKLSPIITLLNYLLNSDAPLFIADVISLLVSAFKVEMDPQEAQVTKYQIFRYISASGTVQLISSFFSAINTSPKALAFVYKLYGIDPTERRKDSGPNSASRSPRVSRNPSMDVSSTMVPSSIQETKKQTPNSPVQTNKRKRKKKGKRGKSTSSSVQFIPPETVSESDSKSALELYLSLLKFLDAVTSYSDSGIHRKAVFARTDVGSSTLLVLRETAVAAAVLSVSEFVLHTGGSKAPPIKGVRFPEHILAIVTFTMRILNNVARLDLSLLQSFTRQYQTQLYHVLCRLVEYVSYSYGDSTHVQDLTKEIILFCGYSSLFNQNNQALFRWGRYPTLLQRLCDLPFFFFSDAV